MRVSNPRIIVTVVGLLRANKPISRQINKTWFQVSRMYHQVDRWTSKEAMRPLPMLFAFPLKNAFYWNYALQLCRVASSLDHPFDLITKEKDARQETKGIEGTTKDWQSDIIDLSRSRWRPAPILGVSWAMGCVWNSAASRVLWSYIFSSCSDPSSSLLPREGQQRAGTIIFQGQ